MTCHRQYEMRPMCTVSMAMVVGVMIGGLSVLMTPRAIAGDLSLASAPREASVDLTPPLYEPRLHPSPKARIEGVARALDNNGPIVLPLVPDHVGLTMVRHRRHGKGHPCRTDALNINQIGRAHV